MNPLVWLALPVVITVIAAFVLFRRGDAAPPDRDEQVSRMARALKRHEP